MATLIQNRGAAIDFTPGVDIAAGTVVVQGELVGVATRPIASGELGALMVAGVFSFPKATGGGTAIAAGALVYWDVADTEAKEDDETGTNKLIGKSIKAASDEDATVEIRLDQ